MTTSCFLLRFAHTKRLNVDNVIVAALDADTETLCKQHNIPYTATRT